MSAEGCLATYSTTNPDISGIGVRISFYLQAILGVWLADRSWEDAPIALWTFIATSFGLTIAAAANYRELTFFQALQVSNLVWMANFGIFVALASYSRQKHGNLKQKKARKPDYGVKFGAMFQTLLSQGLTIYMWATAKTFGPAEISNCSHLIKFALFAFKVPAIDSGRVLGLTLSTVLTVIYLATSAHEMCAYWRTRRIAKVTTAEAVDLEKAKGRQRKRDVSSPTSSRTKIPTTPTTLASPSKSSNSLTLPSSASPQRPQRKQWSAENLDPMLIGVMICQLLVFSYFIVSSELLLRYNVAGNGDGESRVLGFGQILALVVVLPSLLSVIGAWRQNGFRRLTRGARSRRQKRRA